MQRTVILIVDDDDSYQILLPRLVEKSGAALSLHFVEDGEDAIHYLQRREAFVDSTRFPFPKLLLLDIKMARIDGFEFLTWKCQHPEFDSLPIIVWSSSDLDRDRQKAFSLGATHYFHKPSSNDSLLELLLRLEQLAHTLDAKDRMSAKPALMVNPDTQSKATGAERS